MVSLFLCPHSDLYSHGNQCHAGCCASGCTSRARSLRSLACAPLRSFRGGGRAPSASLREPRPHCPSPLHFATFRPCGMLRFWLHFPSSLASLARVRHAGCLAYVARSLRSLASPAGAPRHCLASAPPECSANDGSLRFAKKMGYYVYLCRCNIIIIVFRSGRFCGFSCPRSRLCLRFVGASCAPAPRRPHGGQCLRGARAGRAPPSPFGRALRAPASATRPLRAPLRHRPPFPRHPRGRSAPRKRASPALSGVPHRVFSFICCGVPLGINGTNLGCE